jgi:hypothetical protein
MIQRVLSRIFRSVHRVGAFGLVHLLEQWIRENVKGKIVLYQRRDGTDLMVILMVSITPLEEKSTGKFVISIVNLM